VSGNGHMIGFGALVGNIFFQKLRFKIIRLIKHRAVLPTRHSNRTHRAVVSHPLWYLVFWPASSLGVLALENGALCAQPSSTLGRNSALSAVPSMRDHQGCRGLSLVWRPRRCAPVSQVTPAVDRRVRRCGQRNHVLTRRALAKANSHRRCVHAQVNCPLETGHSGSRTAVFSAIPISHAFTPCRAAIFQTARYCRTGQPYRSY
jgi:hypothetical protein